MTDARPMLLVVDDEPGVLHLISRFAREQGFDVSTASTGAEALEVLESRRPAVAMVDLRMPDVGGLDVLRSIRDVDPDCQVILMTAHATVDSAIEAVKLGALDYVSKPFDFERLAQLIGGVRDEIARRERLLQAESALARDLEFCGMLGRSPAMQELFGLIRRLAPYVRTALVTGETGTGKELVARALHRAGPRKDKRFVAINCSAVVETLFESELFGHMRGAFTGATDNKAGLFEAADGGTLFLDEVGELPLPMQAKLLRVLETGEVRRVGSLEARKVDVRVVAATNRNLDAEAASGKFRSDLFYRLNVVELHVKPLRDRPEDIPYLSAAFVRETASRLGKPVKGLTPAAEVMLVANRWPGNVRELRNVIERACILADSVFISDRDLAKCVRRGGGGAHRRAVPRPGGTSQEVEADERARLEQAMLEAGGNKNLAAELLGISRFALYRKLARFKIEEPAPERVDAG
jgi:DNA-binding NtrC family response regulator